MFALLLLSSLAVRAQTTADWQVVVYADGANALQVLTAEGVALSIPAGTLPLRVGFFPDSSLVAVTPDRRALAALNFTEGQRLSVTIAAFGDCCDTVTLAESGVMLANIGGFSPDGRRFVVSYLAVTDEATRQFDSAVVTIDVELGAVISRLEQAQIGADFAWVRAWTDEGIEYLPFCYGCDRPAAGLLSRWNPDTGEVTPNVGYYSAAQDVLASSGEILEPSRRPDFPLPVSEGQEAEPNVLAFDSGSGIRVIYYNPRSLQIDSAHWVADGWQVLVEHPNATVLLDRSGVQRAISVDDRFLVGTPDGWLATRSIADALEVVHHTLTDLDGEVIARFYHPIAVLQAPALGATASRGGFPDVVSPVAQLTCPDALPPRLFSGGSGRVIGGGVNLRRQPSVTAASVTMITDQVFNVISGPNCDPTGIVWWEVGIGGVHGWMAESKDRVYLLEPVLH
ncbi:MAG: hypothetical protein ABI835_09440 [Chloroflexota bacterium]